MPTHDSSEETQELTGRDASINEAEMGDSASLASADTAQHAGLRQDEDDDTNQPFTDFRPSGAPDIEPDRIVDHLAGEPASEWPQDVDEASLTARPRDDIRPINASELPSDDPDAATDDEDAHERARGNLPEGSDPRDVLH